MLIGVSCSSEWVQSGRGDCLNADIVMRLPLRQQLCGLPIPNVRLAVTIATEEKIEIWEGHSNFHISSSVHCLSASMTCRGNSSPGWSPIHTHTRPPYDLWRPKQRLCWIPWHTTTLINIRFVIVIVNLFSHLFEAITNHIDGDPVVQALAGNEFAC